MDPFVTLVGMTLPLTTRVTLGAALLGATAGMIGAYAVLRRRALLGDVLAHASLPGVCLAFLLTGLRETFLLAVGALLAALAGVFCVSQLVRWTRTREDAAMGIVLSTFFGIGIVLLTLIQTYRADGNQAGLDSYLLGEIASLRTVDVIVLSIAALVVAVACFLAHKELQLYSFDEGFARALGWPTSWIDFALMGAVALVVVLGLPICGAVLIAALLIFPSAAARYWTNRLSRVVVLSALIGAGAGAGGALCASPALAADSFLGQLVRNSRGELPPPGPTIVLVGAGLFTASVLFAPSRGVLAAAWRHQALCGRIQRDHLLRSFYELTEIKGPLDREVTMTELSSRFRSGPWTSWKTLAFAERSGLVASIGESFRLTPDGLAEARRLTRVHRLWELFLVRHADIAADHVDRPADDIEHALPEEIINELEAELASDGRLPVPPSPHEIEV